MYLSYDPHIWHDGYFQRYAPNEGHGVKVMKVISNIILLRGHSVYQNLNRKKNLCCQNIFQSEMA